MVGAGDGEVARAAGAFDARDYNASAAAWNPRGSLTVTPALKSARRIGITRAMKILVSNDDGYRAAGLRALASALAAKFDITVVAPESNCSGASNSLSLMRELQVTERTGRADGRAWPVYCVRGTPADSVHLAVNGMLDFEPDMVVAGVNHGANLGDDVLYSGTVAAAIEGRFLGLPALAVSLHGVDHDAAAERFAPATWAVLRLLENLRARPLAQDTILNINVPARPLDELRGFQATRLGARHPAMPIIPARDGGRPRRR